MHWDERRQKFRALLEGDQCHFPASVYDPMSARMAESLDFEMAMLAGSVAAMQVMAAPDWMLITASEFVELTSRICKSFSLPLLVDADHGYGTAMNVQRTVADLDDAGLAAMTIEDTVLPLPFGSDGKASMIPLEEGLGKMKAALAGRHDAKLAIIARTSAVRISGIDEAIVRGQAYEKAGVDAIAFIGIQDVTELEALCGAVSIPVMLGGGGHLATPEALAAHGVRICLRGHQPHQAAVQAAYDTMRAIREGASDAELPARADGELLGRLTNTGLYGDYRKAFME